jgi:hypothetical protein
MPCFDLKNDRINIIQTLVMLDPSATNKLQLPIADILLHCCLCPNILIFKPTREVRSLSPHKSARWIFLKKIHHVVKDFGNLVAVVPVDRLNPACIAMRMRNHMYRL